MAKPSQIPRYHQSCKHTLDSIEVSNCICFCHALSHIAKGYGVETFINAHAKFAVHTVERRLGQKLQLRYALQTSRVEDALQAFQDVINEETEQLQELWSGLLVDGTYHDHTTADGDGVEMAVEDERYVFDSHVRCNISYSYLRSPSPILTSISATPPTGNSVASTVDVGDNAPITVSMLRALTQDILKKYRKS